MALLDIPSYMLGAQSGGGGGAVQSVNGKTGAVVLAAEDIKDSDNQTIQANIDKFNQAISEGKVYVVDYADPDFEEATDKFDDGYVVLTKDNSTQHKYYVATYKWANGLLFYAINDIPTLSVQNSFVNTSILGIELTRNNTWSSSSVTESSEIVDQTVTNSLTKVPSSKAVYDALPVANVETSPTATLTKLKIGGTNYQLAGSNALTYEDYESMVTAFNAAAKKKWNVGQNVYIATVDVPDLWIQYNEAANKVTYTYTTDAQFIADLTQAAEEGLQIGWMIVNRLESEKVSVPVQDVKINGTTILSGGVANIPISGDNVGVVKIQGNGLTINASTGVVGISAAGNSVIENKNSAYQPIVPTNLDKAVMEGLGNNSLTWTEAYKTSARQKIGVKDIITFNCEMADGTTKTLSLHASLT